MAKKSKPKRKGKAKRKRDYKAEYRRRLALGQRRGLTVQQSRGKHPGEKPAKTHRGGKVANRIWSRRWEVGKQIVTQAHGDAYYQLRDSRTEASGWKYNKAFDRFERVVPDLRVYHVSEPESREPYATAKRLARNAAKRYDFFSVRMLCSELPYGNAVLKAGWTEPFFVTDEAELFDAIYNGFEGFPGYWGLREDEPDEGRRTLIIALAIT